MMTRRTWSFGVDRQVSATAMITTRAVPTLSPAHHRRVARTHLTQKDFADPLHINGWQWALRHGRALRGAEALVWRDRKSATPGTRSTGRVRSELRRPRSGEGRTRTAGCP
jgi:hypothetical protein